MRGRVKLNRIRKEGVMKRAPLSSSIDELCNLKLSTVMNVGMESKKMDSVVDTGVVAYSLATGKTPKPNTFLVEQWERLSDNIHQLSEKPPYSMLSQNISYVKPGTEGGAVYETLGDEKLLFDKQAILSEYVNGVGNENLRFEQYPDPPVGFYEHFDRDGVIDELGIKGITTFKPILQTYTLDEVIRPALLCVVKLWGFGGMGAARSPFALYSAAVEHLVDVNGLKEKAMAVGNPAIVLYFDGDDAFNDENPDKFSHAAFAPYVASEFKRFTTPILNVGCVIVKSGKGLSKGDPNNDRRNKAVIGKLMSPDPSYPGLHNLNTEIVPGKNSWPFFFDVKGFTAWQIVVADTMDNDRSEAKCEALLRYANLHTAPRHCLCVGGNTGAGGVGYLIKYFEEEAKLFDSVVYVPMSQYGA
ncbi:hypothetical protein N9S30_00060 [bacterium]|nr:hypothetical protein [bacterium]